MNAGPHVLIESMSAFDVILPERKQSGVNRNVLTCMTKACSVGGILILTRFRDLGVSGCGVQHKSRVYLE